MRTKRPLALATASLLLSAAIQQALAADLSTTVQFNISRQPLSAAVLQYAQQSGIQVTSPSTLLEGKLTAGISGQLSAGSALQQLLDGTGLVYEVVDESTVAIREASERPASTTEARTVDAKPIRLAQGDSVVTNGSDAAREGSERLSLEEIVVTGSHIRGARNLFSPVITLGREEIEASGFATTQQLIQSLPQNSNTVSDMTNGNVNGGPDMNTFEGAALNLRGLGSDATLVLLNGRRLAPAGRGSYVDISLIPLGAVERVEILTDGASAIYGSDAVGGVVNLILRKDFEGAETRARYGTVTQGDHSELQIGQLLGHSWGSGQVLFNYEYYDRTALGGEDRDFYQPTRVSRGLTLIPEQNRHGALASITQRISDAMNLAGEFFASQRESNSHMDTRPLGFLTESSTEMKQYGGSVGVNLDVTAAWQLRLTGLFDRNDTQQLFSYPEVPTFDVWNENQVRVWSVDAAADGPLIDLPGGSARLAFGGQYRDEHFVEGSELFPTQIDRNVSAVYAELLVPIVGAENRRSGLEHVELTLAGRFEDYSDFGSTFNPKVGLAWSPVSGLNVRGTWGTSFKAPLLTQLNSQNLAVTVYEDTFPDGLGLATGLFLSGNGMDLGPEESINRTFGIDFVPPTLAGLNLSATYFDIDYRRRIREALPSGYDFYSLLLNPMYSSVVTRHPDPASTAPYLALPRTVCITADWLICDGMTPPGEIDAVIDNRLMNVASMRVAGVDLSVRYAWKSFNAAWAFNLGGAYLLDNVERIALSAPKVSQLNDVWRPVDLRLRGSFNYVRGPVSASVFVNYTDSYRDTRSASNKGPLGREAVASWTTLDLTLQYDLSRHVAGNAIKGAALSLSAINVLDRDPPFVGHAYGLYFDGVNANPLGRFLAAQAVIRW